MSLYLPEPDEAFNAIVSRTVDLERRQFAIDFKVSPEALAERTHLTFVADECGGQLARIFHHVYGRAAAEVVSYPATWWDAFKLAHFPAWALKRWPARWTRVEVKAEALFPELVGKGSRHRVVFVCDESRRLA